MSVTRLAWMEHRYASSKLHEVEHDEAREQHRERRGAADLAVVGARAAHRAEQRARGDGRDVHEDHVRRRGGPRERARAPAPRACATNISATAAATSASAVTLTASLPR